METLAFRGFSDPTLAWFFSAPSDHASVSLPTFLLVLSEMLVFPAVLPWARFPANSEPSPRELVHLFICPLYTDDALVSVSSPDLS